MRIRNIEQKIVPVQEVEVSEEVKDMMNKFLIKGNRFSSREDMENYFKVIGNS